MRDPRNFRNSVVSYRVCSSILLVVSFCDWKLCKIAELYFYISAIFLYLSYISISHLYLLYLGRCYQDIEQWITSPFWEVLLDLSFIQSHINSQPFEVDTCLPRIYWNKTTNLNISPSENTMYTDLICSILELNRRVLIYKTTR